MPFDLLSQPFCWLTFSHWTTNSVNRGRASHTTRNKRLQHYLPHRNLDVCKSSRLSHQAYGVLCSLLGTKELTGKSRGGGVCFFINNLWCDERNLHSIKSFCSPDLDFTKGIHSDHNHSSLKPTQTRHSRNRMGI